MRPCGWLPSWPFPCLALPALRTPRLPTLLASTPTGAGCRRRVNVVTPAGKMLARQLSLQVRPGHSLLVTGPNGSGKTSVFR